MGRLIDEDELLTRIRLNYNNHQNVSAGAIKDIIDTTKIAYDVEKVVAELETKKGTYFDGLVCEGTMIRINEAIDIVRKGGING